MVRIEEGDWSRATKEPSWLEQAWAGVTTAIDVNVFGTPQVAQQVAETGIDLSMKAGEWLTGLFPTTIPLGGDNGNGNGNGKKNRFLPYVGLTILGIAAAPAIYRAATGARRGKKGQANEKIASELSESSNRAITILSSMAPVLAFPVAYIGIDELENRGIISGKLGDDVQVLMTTMAAASLLGPLGSLIKSVV